MQYCKNFNSHISNSRTACVVTVCLHSNLWLPFTRFWHFHGLWIQQSLPLNIRTMLTTGLKLRLSQFLLISLQGRPWRCRCRCSFILSLLRRWNVLTFNCWLLFRFLNLDKCPGISTTKTSSFRPLCWLYSPTHISHPLVSAKWKEAISKMGCAGFDTQTTSHTARQY